MCVCLGPAKLSNTILYVGPAVRAGKPVHVLGYQNKAQNLSFAATGVPSGMTVGNAMILPFPAAAPMGPQNVLDTSGCKRILKDISAAIPPAIGVPFSLGASDAMPKSRAMVFDTGIYTVVLAKDPNDIPEALKRVPEAKRPALNPEIFAAYAKWYPGWQVALCCFDNRQAVEADPLLWWYEPADPSRYFFPTLDSHTGGVPDLTEVVALDHVIASGTDGTSGVQVRYRDDVGDALRGYLPKRVVGCDLTDEELPNGDFFVEAAAASQGRFRPDRVTPGSHAAISL